MSNLSTQEEEIVRAFLALMRKAPSYDRETTLKYVTSEIAKEHNTHQQSIIRGLITVVGEYHEVSGGGDLRNEGAIKFSKAVYNLALSGDYPLPYI